MTRDVEGAKAFYGAALGWTFAPMPMPDGTYWLVMASGEAPVAGLFDQFMPKEEPEEDGKPKEEKKLTLDGLMQVMAMGAGAPMLGDLKKTNFEKPESEGGAALQFELEANNFDLNTRGTYFDNGSTGTSTTYDNPGFFENLMSGGKLQREYDERMRKKRGEK